MAWRGVGARLSLALLLVLAGAFGILYLIVVPSLEDRLVDAKLGQLAQSTRTLAHELTTVSANPSAWQLFASDASETANARVVIYSYYGPPATLQLAADSHTVNSKDVLDDPIAMRAAQQRKEARGTLTREDQRYAEVAVRVDPQTVLLLSASLRDSLANVGLVQRRLLAAGGLALLVALVLGLGGAAAFAGRLRRLERAADRIAGGDFGEPVVDEGSDEVGELARAFERMRQRLAQLENARREFIANASHELRTPLFSLAGFLELLTDEEVDERTREEFLETMREQVERLTKLATELLDLSRLDAGRLRVEREEIDLAEVAGTVVREFAAVAKAREHGLELARSAPAPALGDAERVLQIARALVENALVHTPAGTPVRVATASGAGRAALSVEDEGGGIPPEHLAHVFERFYRSEGAKASGSGLGLAIARELAGLMEGTLRLDSSPGRTVFTLSLPAGVAAGAGDERGPARAAREQEAFSRGNAAGGDG